MKTISKQDIVLLAELENEYNAIFDRAVYDNEMYLKWVQKYNTLLLRYELPLDTTFDEFSALMTK